MGKNIQSFDNFVLEMAKKFDPFNYPKYDAEKLGYGNPDVWKSIFNQKMGYDEAEEIMSESEMNPYEVLGITVDATLEEIKKAYRKKSKETHPDVNPGMDGSAFRLVNAAYIMLTEKR